jgi:hypothetical protein
MKGPRAAEAIRFAADTVFDPAAAVRRWKVLSGRKAIGCPLFFPVPEIVACVGLLPVLASPGETLRSLLPLLDAWIAPPAPFPPGLEGALDRVESLAEWAESVSGRPCTEGALGKSLRAFGERDAVLRLLSERCEAEPGLLDRTALRNVIRSGRYLPAEAHALLLERILGDIVRTAEPEEVKGDPFLHLARRIFENHGTITI